MQGETRERTTPFGVHECAVFTVRAKSNRMPVYITSTPLPLVTPIAEVGNRRPGGHKRPPPSLNAALRLIDHNITVALVSAQTGKHDPL